MHRYTGRISRGNAVLELVTMGLLLPWWIAPVILYQEGWVAFASPVAVIALLTCPIGPAFIARSTWSFLTREPLVILTEAGIYDRRCVGPDRRMRLIPWAEIADVELSVRTHWGVKIETSLRLEFKRKNASPFNVSAAYRWFLFKTTRAEYLLNSIDFGVYEGELLDYIKGKIGTYRPSSDITPSKPPRGVWTEGHNNLLAAIEEVGTNPAAGRYKIKQILATGIDLNAKDKDGWTLLTIVRYYESPGWIISLLRDHGASEK